MLSVFAKIGQKLFGEMGMPGKPRDKHLLKMTPEQVAECVRMYDSGLSIGELASNYGITRQGMWGLLRIRTTMRPQRRTSEDNHFYRGGLASDDKAHNLLEKAVAKGVVSRGSQCETCGISAVKIPGQRYPLEAHHDDYNKPLDVRWLCRVCHHEWHKTNVAIPRREAPK